MDKDLRLLYEIKDKTRGLHIETLREDVERRNLQIELLQVENDLLQDKLDTKAFGKDSHQGLGIAPKRQYNRGREWPGDIVDGLYSCDRCENFTSHHKPAAFTHYNHCKADKEEGNMF